MTPDIRKQIEAAADTFRHSDGCTEGCKQCFTAGAEFGYGLASKELLTENSDSWDKVAKHWYGIAVARREELEACKREYADYVNGKPGSWYVVELQKERDALQARVKHIELANKEMTRNDHATFGELLMRVKELESSYAECADSYHRCALKYAECADKLANLEQAADDMARALERADQALNYYSTVDEHGNSHPNKEAKECDLMRKALTNYRKLFGKGE